MVVRMRKVMQEEEEDRGRGREGEPFMLLTSWPVGWNRPTAKKPFECGVYVAVKGEGWL